MAKEIILEEDDRDSNDQQNDLKVQCNSKTAPSTSPYVTHLEPTGQNKEGLIPCQEEGHCLYGKNFQTFSATKFNLPLSTMIDQNTPLTHPSRDQNDEFESLINEVCGSELNTPDIKVFDPFEFGVPNGCDSPVNDVTRSPLMTPILKEEERIANTPPLRYSLDTNHSLNYQNEPNKEKDSPETQSIDDNLAMIQNCIDSDKNIHDTFCKNVQQLKLGSVLRGTENLISISYSGQAHPQNQFETYQSASLISQESSNNSDTGNDLSNGDWPSSYNNNMESFQPIDNPLRATNDNSITDMDILNFNDLSTINLDNLNSMLAEPEGNILERACEELFPEQSSEVEDKINSFLKLDDQPNHVPYFDQPTHAPHFDLPSQVQHFDQSIQVPHFNPPSQVPYLDQPNQVPHLNQANQVPLVNETHSTEGPSQPINNSIDKSQILKLFVRSFGTNNSARVIDNVRIVIPKDVNSPPKLKRRPLTPSKPEFDTNLTNNVTVTDDSTRFHPSTRETLTTTLVQSSLPEPSTSTTPVQSSLPEPSTSRGHKRKVKPTAKYITAQEHQLEEEDVDDIVPKPKRRGKFSLAGLSDSEKYRRIRSQNNLASKKCREKKKEEAAKLNEDVRMMQQRVDQKKEKIEKLDFEIRQFKKLLALGRRRR